MFLKEHTLRNFKQHTHKHLTFNGNIVGIIGRNGVGKSNLLGSLQYAFAGEQPGYLKKDLLQWGAATGSVETTFTHNGMDCTLYRALHNNDVRFDYGKDTYRSATKVAEALSTLVGIDKDICRQTLFVRQAEIDAVLFTDPRVRELAFQKLCGIGDASKIHKLLGEKIAGLDSQPNYDESIATGLVRHAEMQTRLVALQGAHSQAVEKRKQCSDIIQLRTQLAQLEGSVTRTRQHTEFIAQLAGYTKTKQEAEAKLTALPVINANMEELNMQLKTLHKLRDDATQYQDRVRALEEAGKAITALGDAPTTDAQLKQLEQEVVNLQQNYARIRGQLDMYNSLLQVLMKHSNVDQKCPLCEHPIQDGAALVALLKTKTGALQQSLVVTDPTAKNGELKQLNATLMQYTANYRARTSRFSELEAAIKSLTPVAQSVTDIQMAITHIQGQINSYLAGIQEDTRLKAQIKNTTEFIETLKSNIGTLEQEGVVTDISATTVAIMNLRTVIDTAISIDQEIAKLGGMISELEKNLQDLRNTITQLEYKRDNQETYRKAVQVLTSVRDWFHYSNGPHTVASAVLDELTSDLNTFLGQFSAPFTVIGSGEGLGFRCMFTDGRALPEDGPPDAMHLSGGEKIQLAIAFRLASYCMFANRLGLLSLDEPTVYLDDMNVGNFCTLLEKVRTVAKNMNLQILISTHERSTMPYMDTIIDLNATTA